jgi:subtilisin family serine protease
MVVFCWVDKLNKLLHHKFVAIIMAENNQSINPDNDISSAEPNSTPKFFKSLIKFERKNFYIIVSLFFILLAIPVTYVLVSNRQDNKASAAYSKRASTTGYIVEYKKDSLQKTLKKGSNKSEIDRQVKEINDSNKNAENDILKILNKNEFSRDRTDDSKVKVKANYIYAINGIALEITKEEAEKLKKSAYVKAVYPDLEVKTNLNSSVSLIGANYVWGQVKDPQNLPVTGKGINIAVLDTGVDFSHQDLGGTQIQERQLTKINNKTTQGGFTYYDANNTPTDYSDDRIVYDLNDSVVSVYSFSNGATSEYNVIPSGLSNYYVSAAKIFGNKLLYRLTNNQNGTEDAGLYIMDLNSNEKTRVAGLMNSTKQVAATGKHYLYGDKVLYMKLLDAPTFTYGIFVKNLTTGEEQKITTDQTYPQQPVYYGNKMVYSVVVNGSIPNQVLYNIDTGEKTNLATPDANTIADFNGEKILYMAYSNHDYLLYDISTGASQRIKVPASAGNNKFAPQSLTTVGTGVYGGLIGDGVVFFQRDRNSWEIMANDQGLNKFSQINLITPSSGIYGAGKRVCFDNKLNWDIYCHDYDSNYSYPMPINTNSKVVGGYNFVHDSNHYLDDHEHGSHVSGIIAGNGSLKGVAPDANIVAYKVMNSLGGGFTSDIIAAIDQSIATRLDTDPSNDISVMNISIGADCGGYYDSGCGPNDITSQAVDRASEAGISVVVSAGNSGPGASTIESPGTARTAITVGAVNKSKVIADFSSRGPVSVSGEMVSKPDVLAPGVDICSVQLFGTFYASRRCFDQTHVSFSGTSMAAPHVAGLVALLKQLNPDWTPTQIKTAIKNSTDNLGYDANTQGSGLVNALKLFSISAPAPTSTPSPTLTPTKTLTPTPTLTPTKTPTPTPARDITPPSVSITNPLNNATVTRNTTVTIAATASDNVALRGVDFFVAGKLLCSDTTAPYTCAWKVPAKSKVTYTISARAVDTSNNTASATISVKSN